MESGKLIVSSSPHQFTAISTPIIMSDVLFALMPACFAGVWFFGLRALGMIAACVGSAVVTEALLQKLCGKPITVSDYSAAVTGLLLALVVPPDLPIWVGVFGSVFSISIAKFTFGGLGHNIFNPALIGRAFLLASWPVFMTKWRWPIQEAPWMPGFDAVTTATPLVLMKHFNVKVPYNMLFFGKVAGTIGETSAIAILLGAAYLMYRGHIGIRIPFSFIGTVVVITALFGQDPLFHVLTGGLLLGAFFMATDYVTSPVTPKGKVAYGIGCGVLVALIRLYGGYPEGVCYAILIMNAATALIERYTLPRKFGEVKKLA
ncbi:MAG: RnfABCDGE type electron transport complex subunit D [Firmicutes bacterium]|nr:RnfABCDGE type electron transport complex subunit D [Bacillota bacterium]